MRGVSKDGHTPMVREARKSALLAMRTEIYLAEEAIHFTTPLAAAAPVANEACSR